MPYPYNSSIKIYSGVALDTSNQRDFQNESEQNAFFAKHLVSSFSECTFVREGFVKIRDSWVDCMGANYMSYTNYDDKGRAMTVYGYITDVQFINANLVAVSYEVDVFQTYLFRVTWKPSFIERRHVKNYVSGSVPYIHTIPEGVDFGNAYTTVHKTTVPYTKGRTVMIASSIDIEKSGGSADAPSIVGSDGVTFDYTPNMLAYYLVGIQGTSSLQAFLAYFADRPWITQGFLFMTTIPDIFVYSSDGVVGSWIEPSVSISTGTEGIEAVTCGKLKNGAFIQPKDFLINDFFSYFPDYKTGKLKLYPYSFIELSFENGNTMILKPELIEGNDLKFKILPYIGANTQIRAVPQNYAGEATNSQEGLTYSNFPNYPIQIDNYLLYMANNQSTIETTRQQMQSNLVYKTVKTGAQALLSTVQSGVGAMNATTNYQNPAAFASPGLAVGSAFAGYAGNLINGTIETYDIYRTGKQNIEMYEASMQDMEMKPPSLACGFGGEGYNTKYGYGLTIRWKTIRQEYRVILEDYFNRFGIKNHRFEVPNYRTRSDFDYLKITEPFIVGEMPYKHLVNFKRIFENGVWLWHTDEIGG